VDYSVYQIARLEHEQRVRSLAPVSEFGSPMKVSRSGWIIRQAGRLLYALGNRLASLGERMKYGREISLKKEEGIYYEMDYS
jgi:hypothetical protein